LPLRGEASFLGFAGAVLVTASAPVGTFTAHRYQANEFADGYHKITTTTNRMTLSTMAEPVPLKDIQPQLFTDHQDIPSGVMQAVLMHALQLRRNCREVFLLCDIQRHSLAEAATILGITRPVAKRRLQLARRRMNEVIEHLCGQYKEPNGWDQSERSE